MQQDKGKCREIGFSFIRILAHPSARGVFRLVFRLRLVSIFPNFSSQMYAIRMLSYVHAVTKRVL